MFDLVELYCLSKTFSKCADSLSFILTVVFKTEIIISMLRSPLPLYFKCASLRHIKTTVVRFSPTRTEVGQKPVVTPQQATITEWT